MAKVRFKARFFIIALILLAGIILAVVLLSREPETARLQTGTLSYESTKNSVIVRNAQVYTSSTWGNVTYLAAEGERVTEGTKIAVVYKDGYNDKLLQDLVTAQQKINDYINETVLKNVVNTDLDEVNTRIQDVTDRIEKVIHGNSEEDLLVLEQLLTDTIEERQTKMREAVKQPTPEYEVLLQEEQALLERLNTWKTEIVAEGTGMVSFYFDQYEAFLSMSTIDTLTRSDILNLMNGKPLSSSTTAGAGEPLYRLVDNFKWHCIFLVDGTDSTELTVGEKYNITFDGFYARPYEGTVVSAKNLEASTMFVVEMTEDIGPLLSIRQANANLKKEYQGLIAPVRAIRTNDDGQTYVLVVNNENVLKVPVTVVFSDGENAIIESADASMTLSSNQIVELK